MTQRGLFARVAKQLGLDPSYVSRVASGQRQNTSVVQALEAELGKTFSKSRKIARAGGKR
jgi:hypothetical protein